MKKLMSLIAILVIGVSGLLYHQQSVKAVATKKFTVSLKKCVDGDTAEFTKVGKTRFLYIDTPESTTQIEPYGKEAASYTCKLLKGAKKIELQYDGPKKDKYNRTLAWVWVNGSLVQKSIINKGYVEKFYDYGTYSYESELRTLQAKAQKDKVGMWKTAKAPATSNKTENFANCTELRKKYPNGVKKGHPAYQAKMDRDKDNYACEK